VQLLSANRKPEENQKLCYKDHLSIKPQPGADGCRQAILAILSGIST